MTWTESRTDGSVFGGVTPDETIRIVPRFNEAATLDGQHDEGRIRRGSSARASRPTPGASNSPWTGH